MESGRIFPLEDCRVGRDPESLLFGRLDGPDSDVKDAVPANQMVVFLLQAIEMDGQGQIGRRLDPVQVLLQKDGIGAEVDKSLPVHETLDDFPDFVMDEGFTSRDGDNRSPAFIRRLKALLRRQAFVQNFLRILDLPASRTFEIAPEKRFQHEDKGKPLFAFHFLTKYIGADLYGLMQGYRHAVNLELEGREVPSPEIRDPGRRKTLFVQNKGIYQNTSLILGVEWSTVKKRDQKLSGSGVFRGIIPKELEESLGRLRMNREPKGEFWQGNGASEARPDEDSQS